MSEKRFLYRNFLEEEVEKRFTEEYDEEWGIYLSDNLTGDWYNINPYEIADTCNELWEQVVKLREENEQLKQKIQRWKTLYEIKDKEVTARVDALNKVCEYYTSEVLFKSDVDPNKAVQEVINEILNTEVEMW